MSTPEIGENYSEILLPEEYHRQFQDLHATNVVVEHFRLRVGLVLNPNYDDLSSLKEDVQTRTKQIQSKTWDVIDKKSKAQLRNPKILGTLKEEIKKAVNGMLGAKDGGPEIVSEVIFPDRTLLQQ